MATRFFDTYALLAVVTGSPRYERYKDGLLTTTLNLMELYYWLCRKFDESTAERNFTFFSPYALDPERHHLKAAARFRVDHPGLSYVDCLGYLLAQEHGLPFLTGDDGFRGMENVEFVKE